MQTDVNALLQSDPTQDQSQGLEEDKTQSDVSASQEEQEFNKLSGSTQDRIRSLVKRARTAEEDAERAKALALNSTTKLPPPPPTYNPDVKDAVGKLSDAGIATKEYVESLVNNLRQQDRYQSRLTELERTENGQNGRPRFEKYEYEDFVKTNPQYQYYDPKDVYDIMYKEELTDWTVKNYKAGGSTQSMKSNRSTSEMDVWTPEYIEENIKTQGVQWYEKNIDKINKVLSR